MKHNQKKQNIGTIESTSDEAKTKIYKACNGYSDSVKVVLELSRALWALILKDENNDNDANNGKPKSMNKCVNGEKLKEKLVDSIGMEIYTLLIEALEAYDLFVPINTTDKHGFYEAKKGSIFAYHSLPKVVTKHSKRSRFTLLRYEEHTHPLHMPIIHPYSPSLPPIGHKSK